MRALVFEKGLCYRANYPMPQLGDEDALIKVIHAGICNTDLEITKGYMGFQGIPGHEFVGIIEECNKEDLVGKRVVGEINIGCRTCYYCQNSMQNHCPNRSVLGILNKNGVFAEYVTLPVRNLHPVPESISDEEALFVEPLAAALEITGQADIRASDKVCVLGDGKLGLLVGQVLFLTGCNLVVVGNHKKKLSTLEKKGIRTELTTSLNEKEFDIVIDCTGSPSGIETALKIVRPKGNVIIKTTIADKRPIDLNCVVINELTLIGSRCGPFEPAIKAIESGAVDLVSLISKIFSLEDGIEAFQYASGRGVLKVILRVI